MIKSHSLPNHTINQIINPRISLHLYPKETNQIPDNPMPIPQTPYEFFDYLAHHARGYPAEDQLPSLKDLSAELGVSVSRLREQLEVAKALGLVEVRPRTGIKRQPYTFNPAIWASLSYAIQVDYHLFYAFARLRVQVELAFWHQAVEALTPDDKVELCSLLDQAETRLRCNPIRVPHAEHRALHLLIYKRLENPFVLGILEAYWDAYEAVGLSVYTGLDYLREVWAYHRKMVNAICESDVQAGYQALVEHTDLLHHRPGSS
jgi:DNA-binding FadR family transcriptional regulator